MTRPGSMLPIAAALTMLLAGCASDSTGRQLNAAAALAIAPVCPTPSDRDRMTRILAELETARAAGVKLDALATEYERLDAAARACRGGAR